MRNESVVTFPSAIGSLPRLEVLSLIATEILGELPQNLGSASSLRELTLVSLYYSSRSLKGFFPASVCNLTLLETLTLRVGLEGFSDSSCLHWPNLKKFNLAGSSEFRWRIDSFNSSVAPRLEYLDIGNTKLSGDLSGICTLSQLKTVSIRESVRFGSLPAAFWQLEHLESITITENSIEGTIGASIGHMKNLTWLWITSCNIGGSIPADIGSCISLETLVLAHIPLQGSLPPSMQNLTQLNVMTISGAQDFGQVPSWLGSLKSLRALELTSLGLTGSVPSSLASLAPMEILDLSNNYLTGSIPQGIAAERLDLSYNSLTGTVPLSIINTLDPRRRVEIDLSHNRLGRSLRGFESLSLMTAFRIDLSSNNFHTRLPQLNFDFSMRTHYRHLLLNHNKFYGPVPSSYNQLLLVRLDNNILNGNIDFFFSPYAHTNTLLLNDNHFNGTIPQVGVNAKLKTLDLSRNPFDPSSFSDSIAILPPYLESLSMSGCSITGNIPRRFAETVHNACNLRHLDLSHNRFTVNDTATLSFLMYACGLVDLDLSSNLLKTNIDSSFEVSFDGTGAPLGRPSNLESLILSRNFLSFGWPYSPTFPRLQVLRMNHNRFVGSLPSLNAPTLLEWDVSYNNFSGSTEYLSTYSNLASFNASHNRISRISTFTLPRIQSMDLNSNEIDQRPDMGSLARSFTLKSLIYYNIANNSLIPTVSELPEELNRTSVSYPSKTLPGVTCYTLAFNGMADRLFITDEKLFEYQQCDCDDRHFGLPSAACLKCPIDASTCGRTALTVPSNSFVFVADNTTHGGLELQVEDCKYSLRQEVSGKTNCLGAHISAQSILNRTVSVANLLAPQCSEGSEGRLCSKCKCDDEKCYFSKIDLCFKCSTTFRPSLAAPLAVMVVILSIIALTVIFYLVLRAKRDTSKEEDWNKLSLPKRILFRMLYALSLGNLPILITFLQILLELTSWNWHLLQFLNLMNGGAIGLECIFPILSDPLKALILHLCVPLIILAICATSIGLAELWWRKTNNTGFTKTSSHMLQSTTGDSLLDPEVHLPSVNHSSYPATALLTSVSLSIVKFFYFGTALAAHTYLFYSTQSYTNIKYVQNMPWMRYSDAITLILVSVPAIIIFDFVIPVSFAYLCYRVRNTPHSTGVSIYFGILFATFSPSCFWWEIVNILRKLSIVLVKQGFIESNALQPMIISTVILGILALQVTMRPWRRSIENFADTISALLLIGSMLASRSTSLEHSEATIYYMASLDAAFVAFCIVTLIFEAATGKMDSGREFESEGDGMYASSDYTKLLQYDEMSDDSMRHSSSEE